jgi:hypothetical protein
MADLPTAVFSAINAVLWAVIAVPLLRALVTKVRACRQHRRNRRWVRTLPVPPACPDLAGRVGTLAAAGVTVTARTPVTPAASTREGHQP